MSSRRKVGVYMSTTAKIIPIHRENQQQADQQPNPQPTPPKLIEGLFRDQYDAPYARIRDVDGSTKVLPVRGQKFKNALVRAYTREHGEPPKASLLKQAIEAAIAEADLAKKVEMHLRIAQAEEKVYYNFADGSGSVIEIDSTGWRVCTDAPVCFREYPLTGSQVQQDRYNSVPIAKVFDWINISDPLARVLMEVCLVSSFMPGIKHPLLMLNGHQGSAKTTAARILKKLVDPSAVDVGPLPKTVAEIAQLLSHPHFTVFDNLSEIKPAVSDLLCQAVTGGVFSKRRLYTDEEDVVLRMDGCVAATGINIVAEKADLLDRTILFRLERISEARRKDEATLWAEVKAATPGLLASIFDTVSEAMARLPKIKLRKAHRMADFYKAGIAISQALGYKNNEFELAMEQNRRNVELAALEGEPLCEAVAMFMLRKSSWKGTASELLQDLLQTNVAGALPKAPNQLSRKLKEVELTLRNFKIHVHWGRDRDTNLTTIHLIKR